MWTVPFMSREGQCGSGHGGWTPLPEAIGMTDHAEVITDRPPALHPVGDRRVAVRALAPPEPRHDALAWGEGAAREVTLRTGPWWNVRVAFGFGVPVAHLAVRVIGQIGELERRVERRLSYRGVAPGMQ